MLFCRHYFRGNLLRSSLSEELSVIWIYISGAVLCGTVSEGVFSLEMQPFVQHWPYSPTKTTLTYMFNLPYWKFGGQCRASGVTCLRVIRVYAWRDFPNFTILHLNLQSNTSFPYIQKALVKIPSWHWYNAPMSIDFLALAEYIDRPKGLADSTTTAM